MLSSTCTRIPNIPLDGDRRFADPAFLVEDTDDHGVVLLFCSFADLRFYVFAILNGNRNTINSKSVIAAGEAVKQIDRR
jgi:hypothetical protein